MNLNLSPGNVKCLQSTIVIKSELLSECLSSNVQQPLYVPLEASGLEVAAVGTRRLRSPGARRLCRALVPGCTQPFTMVEPEHMQTILLANKRERFDGHESVSQYTV